MSTLASLRQDYCLAGLSAKDIAKDPFVQFEQWFQEAQAAQVIESNAMTLATVGTDGTPDARTVLLKGADVRGFVFYTNYESTKGRDLAARPQATLLFPWLALERQVRISGSVTKVSREETDTYFRSRPLGSRLGAWASAQSTVVPDRATLEQSLSAVEARYAGQPVPTPPHWGGYRVIPSSIEFWQGRPNRLHDRLRYQLGPNQDWIISILAP
ncbi:MAG: pyridoxamine 5'-phosphate oxidase [Candidatus Synoicihabitans palmerolidicus]|nr:pyridoxamine 5'-phosphate oxidase [Candidatus Synoicihabitans palmerolidicus]